MNKIAKFFLGFCLIFTEATAQQIGPSSGSVNFNPIYFYTNSQGQISFNPILQSADTRPVADYDLKAGAPFLSNTLNVIFTNNGPCTVTCIRSDTSLYNTNVPLPTITFFIDGASNTVQSDAFFATLGQPQVAWSGDSIDCPTAAWTHQRLCYINAFTNAGICISGGTNWTYYGDVESRRGPPVTSNKWFCIEKAQFIAPNATFTVYGITNNPGQLEAITGFELNTNGQFNLETRPTFYFDTNVYFRNGTEDFWGGSYYFNNGASVVHTPFFGYESEGYLGSKYGFSDGYTAYRFFTDMHELTISDGFYWQTNFNFYITNLTSTWVTNDVLISGWTAH